MAIKADVGTVPGAPEKYRRQFDPGMSGLNENSGLVRFQAPLPFLGCKCLSGRVTLRLALNTRAFFLPALKGQLSLVVEHQEKQTGRTDSGSLSRS